MVNDYLRYHLHDGLKSMIQAIEAEAENHVETEIGHTSDNPVLQEPAKVGCANALTNDVTSQRNYGSGGVELVEFTLNGSNSRNHILEPFHQVQLSFHITVTQPIARFKWVLLSMTGWVCSGSCKQ